MAKPRGLHPDLASMPLSPLFRIKHLPKTNALCYPTPSCKRTSALLISPAQMTAMVTFNKNVQKVHGQQRDGTMCHSHSWNWTLRPAGPTRPQHSCPTRGAQLRAVTSTSISGNFGGSKPPSPREVSLSQSQALLSESSHSYFPHGGPRGPPASV